MAKVVTEVVPTLIQLAVDGKLRIDTEIVRLRDVERTWTRTDLHGKRIVIVP